MLADTWYGPTVTVVERFIAVPVPPVPLPTLEKFWFRFRFRFLLRFGSSSGSRLLWPSATTKICSKSCVFNICYNFTVTVCLQIIAGPIRSCIYWYRVTVLWIHNPHSLLVDVNPVLLLVADSEFEIQVGNNSYGA
jgi:hypothetical protein